MQSGGKRQAATGLATRRPLASAVLLFIAFVLYAHLVDANSYVSLKRARLDPARSLQFLDKLQQINDLVRLILEVFHEAF